MATRIAGRGHAVVVGGSVAGLLAACALAEGFVRVTVVERDALPHGPVPRRGVPHGRHAHVLLARGVAAMDALLPGLSFEMLDAGGVSGDAQADLRWYLDGRPLRSAESGLTTVALSRPLLEHLVRRRVRQLPNVHVEDGTEVVGLLAERRRVAGVRLRAADAGAPETTLGADLVVDASGRGSRVPGWLAERGLPAPPRSGTQLDLVQVSRYYLRQPWHLPGLLGVGALPFPGRPRGGVVLRQEGGRFVVTLAGLHGDAPPATGRGMLAYAETLAGGDVADLVRGAEPVGEPVTTRFPATARVRYERLGRHPDGLLAVGDALCSTNPLSAQGTTVAALEAMVLRDLLAAGAEDLARRFHAEAAGVLDAPWAVGTADDLRFPEAAGRRRAVDGPIARYLARCRAAAAGNAELATAYLRVANLVDPPLRLVAPGHLARVLRAPVPVGPPAWAVPPPAHGTPNERRECA
ncbi:hypothetical protein BJF78_17350 [Pseudonocardia sp. CNS-139]|nr:hypothetical protein BJF78_17350 [Pseudonocardia sp. CNS-139]